MALCSRYLAERVRWKCLPSVQRAREREDDDGMFFALTDLILSTTLMVNAGAVLSFKIPSNGGAGLDGAMTFKERFFVLISSLRVFRYKRLPRPATAAALASPRPSPYLRRIVIGLWNLFVLFLMIVWFP